MNFPQHSPFLNHLPLLLPKTNDPPTVSCFSGPGSQAMSQKPFGSLHLSLSLPVSHSCLRGSPRGGERQDLRPEEGPLRNQLPGAVPVRPGLHPAPRAHHPLPAQWAVGGAADILHKPYVPTTPIPTAPSRGMPLTESFPPSSHPLGMGRVGADAGVAPPWGQGSSEPKGCPGPLFCWNYC